MDAYGIPSKLLTNNSPKFLSEILAVRWGTLAVKNIIITEYRLHTSGQPERFNSTIISRQHSYVPGHKTDWYAYRLSVTPVYSVQIQSFTKSSPLTLTLTRIPREPDNFATKSTNLPTGNDVATPTYAKLEVFKCASKLSQETAKTWDWHKGILKMSYDRLSASHQSTKLVTTYVCIGLISAAWSRYFQHLKGIINYCHGSEELVRGSAYTTAPYQLNQTGWTTQLPSNRPTLVSGQGDIVNMIRPIGLNALDRKSFARTGKLTNIKEKMTTTTFSTRLSITLD